MMANLYRILFQVQLLHEYYLTDSDQTSVYDNISTADAYVTARQEQGRPSVMQLLKVELPAATRDFFSAHQLRLIDAYSGFQVIGKVMRAGAAAGVAGAAPGGVAGGAPGGAVPYAPAIPLAAGANLFFLIRAPLGALATITNGRIQREINSLYYFCNSTLTGAKTYPVLSNPIPDRQSTANYAYQQGELVIDKSDGGAVKFAFYNPAIKDMDFAPAGNTDSLVNEMDRLLVGVTFNYTFRPEDGVTSANFVLKDASGKVIKTTTAGATAPLGAVKLDYSMDAQGNPLPLNTLPDAGLADPILYSLTVTGTNYNKTFPLIFYGGPEELSGCWGLIHLQAVVAGPSYSLLDANGQLAATWPVFQVRCKSMPTFRRYANSNGQPITMPKVTGTTDTGGGGAAGGGAAGGGVAGAVGGGAAGAVGGGAAGGPTGPVPSGSGAADSSSPVPDLTDILQPTDNTLTTLQPVPLTYMPYFFKPKQFAPPPEETSGTAPPAPKGGTAPPAKGTSPPGKGVAPAAKGTAPAAKGVAPAAKGAAPPASTAAPPAKGTIFLPGPGPDPGSSLLFDTKNKNQLISVISVPETDLFPLADASNSNKT